MGCDIHVAIEMRSRFPEHESWGCCCIVPWELLVRSYSFFHEVFGVRPHDEEFSFFGHRGLKTHGELEGHDGLPRTYQMISEPVSKEYFESHTYGAETVNPDNHSWTTLTLPEAEWASRNYSGPGDCQWWREVCHIARAFQQLRPQLPVRLVVWFDN